MVLYLSKQEQLDILKKQKLIINKDIIVSYLNKIQENTLNYISILNGNLSINLKKLCHHCLVGMKNILLIANNENSYRFCRYKFR